MFGRVQEELARRTGKQKVKQVGTKTEQGKYSSKYALTERLVCGECKTPYRRCTWTVKGKKKYVWLCISRLDFGKKYCHESTTIEESVLHEAIMRVFMKTAQLNTDILNTLKLHIGMALTSDESEDMSLALQIRTTEIDAEFAAMLKSISSDSVETFDENKAKDLMNEKAICNSNCHRSQTPSKSAKTRSPDSTIFIRSSTDSTITRCNTMTASSDR